MIGCDGSHCIWQQEDVFSQEMECVAGVCVDDIPASSTLGSEEGVKRSPWTTYIIFTAIVLIILFVICGSEDRR